MANPYKLPLEVLYEWEKTKPNSVFLRQPYPGKGYVDMTYREAGQQVRKIAAAIKARNLPPGSNIGILSKNCAHWILSDLAIWMAGHVSVPLYPNLTTETVNTILKHAEVKLAFIGKLDDLEAYRKGIPSDVPCIAFPYHEVAKAERWDDCLKKFEPLHANPSRAMGELATIIYTSGTTGEPKGVMHPFSSFAISATEILKAINITQDSKFFSYLPLAHVAERLLVETVGLYNGGTVAFAESIDTFQHNLQTIQPNVFLSVPRLWQKFHGGVLAKVPQRKLKLLLSLPIISSLIKTKLKRALGLAEAQFVVTGAAPIAPALIEWFETIGITIQEAYGMTENFAYSHFNMIQSMKLGTAGQPWPLVETKIGANGEILVKSPCNFRGYYHSETKRSDLFEGDFFRTGDRGEIGPEGHLKITGRTKELFKTSKGKYVAPAPIESQIGACPHLEAVCVVGANLPSPLVLAMLSPTAKGLPKQQVSDELLDCLNAVNNRLDPHERIVKVILVRDAWTIASGAITPSMKVKRGFIEDKYSKSIEVWGRNPDRVVWE